MLCVRSGPPHAKPYLVEQRCGECRCEVNRQHLRLMMREAGELRWPDALGIVRMVALESPASVNFVPRAEIMIDADVGLFANVSSTETEPIVGAVRRLGPLESARVQSVCVCRCVVVRQRHG